MNLCRSPVPACRYQCKTSETDDPRQPAFTAAAGDGTSAPNVPPRRICPIRRWLRSYPGLTKHLRPDTSFTAPSMLLLCRPTNESVETLATATARGSDSIDHSLAVIRPCCPIFRQQFLQGGNQSKRGFFV